ncbi:MAG TPA: hypothetical protein VK467_08275 [Gemmatimonadales bacterium]|jgi:hypothetical protein|nr:hypothetical protein [Gemmatimonadales bacterium]
MTAPKFERRDSDRRSGADKRVESIPVAVERRKSDRRMASERRLALQSAAGQLQIALGLLTHIAEAGALNDDLRRALDTATLRLRFALERMERE